MVDIPSTASKQQLRCLLTLARDLMQVSDLYSIFKIVGPVIHEIFLADGAMLIFRDDQHEHIIEFDKRGYMRQGFKEATLYACSTYIENSKTSLILPDVSINPALEKSDLPTLGIHSLIVVSSPPIEPLIILSTYWNEPGEKLELDGYEPILRYIAEFVGAAIGNLVAKRDLEYKVQSKDVKIKKMKVEHAKELDYREQSERETQRISITDVLTGAKNRRGFFLQAEQSFKVAQRRKQPSTLIFIDIDGLKNINDSLGHDVGDRLIQEVAKALQKSFRSIDVVARLGGDEFAAYTNDNAQPEIVLNRIQANISEANRQNLPFFISLSIGIVQCDPLSKLSLLDYLAQADKQMYEKKSKKGLETAI